MYLCILYVRTDLIKTYLKDFDIFFFMIRNKKARNKKFIETYPNVYQFTSTVSKSEIAAFDDI